MKLFLDENLFPQHASELRAEGHQAIRRALRFLQNINIAGRLAVVDEEKIRIRG